MPTMTVVNESHIELDEHGRAWIRGENTKVVELAMEVVAWSWTADDIHRNHPHLPLSKIHAALAYYYDHKAAIDADIERDAQEFERQRAAAGESPLGKKLREQGILHGPWSPRP
jgi:uncharacterized protein (DUF433 family)